MNSLITFIKNHKILSLVLFLFLVIILAFLFLPKNTDVPQNNTQSYNSILPGQTTKEEVLNKLGTPVEQKTIGQSELLTFDSEKTERDDEYYFQNGTAGLIKEIIPPEDTRKADELRQIHGNANLVLYGEDAVAGFYLFVYPSRGIAYIGNPNFGNLLEIWYFTPTTEAEFITNWAQGYSKTQPEPHQNGDVDFN